MVSVDGSLFFQIVNFLVLIYILNIVLFKPIRGILVQRQKKIDGLNDKIKNSKQGAVDKGQAYSDGIKAARAKGAEERQTLIQAAEEEEKKVIGEINQKAQANLAELRSKIAKEVEDARGKLSKEVKVFAEAIGGKILGRAVA